MRVSGASRTLSLLQDLLQIAVSSDAAKDSFGLWVEVCIICGYAIEVKEVRGGIIILAVFNSLVKREARIGIAGWQGCVCVWGGGGVCNGRQ